MPESLTPYRVATPPRSIPPLLAAHTLLGGAGPQIGWLLVAWGSIFFWVFAWNADYSGWRFRKDNVSQAQGQSLGCTKTRFSEESGVQEESVFRNRYRFAAEGHEFEGASYSVKRCVEGGPVTVAYLRDQPAISRIAGMRRAPMGPWVGLVALLPAIGLWFALRGMARGWRNLRLLREGRPTAARLVSKIATGTRTLGHADYWMTFQYPGGRTRVCTHQPERLEEGPETLVFYDPASPEKGLLFRDLPGDVTLDREGQPVRRGPVAFFVLPAISVAANWWYVYRLWVA